MIYSRLTFETPMLASGPFFEPPVTVKCKCPISIADVQRIVAEYFSIPRMEMTSARRSREIARPRQVAMYLAREFTPCSMPAIGRRFGRDHTTIMWGIRRIKELIETDAELATDVETLRGEIGRLA
jgi:chromosomal replication initiator protein